MLSVTINTPLKTDAQRRAWERMQKVILAEYTQDYASLTVDFFHHVGGGKWIAHLSTVKTWGAKSGVPVGIGRHTR